MNRTILVFVGQMASGKDTACDYLTEKYNAKKYSFSGMLNDVLDRFHLKRTRDNYIKLSENIRATFGEDLLAKTITEDIKKEETLIITIPNARRMADIKYLSELPGFVLIEIKADSKTRYERLITRDEKPDDNTKTYEEFIEDQKRSTELSIDEIAKQATEHIDNNGTKEELYSQVEKILNKYAN
jgi:dephospho-CoA kinase